MSEINHENVLTQLRAALNRNSIKLWVEPYCIDGESNESELVVRYFKLFVSTRNIFLCFSPF